jgi:hypothetical protein
MSSNELNKHHILRLQRAALRLEDWWAGQSTFVRWGMVLVWYSVIFMLSALPAAASHNTKEMFGGADIVNMLFRMAAHAFVFAVLAVCVYLALNHRLKYHQPHIVITHCINACFAFSDELHQMYVPGRFFRVQDIVTDVVGGVFVLWLLVRWFRSAREA